MRTIRCGGPPSCARPSTTGSRGTCSYCAYSYSRKSDAGPPKSSRLAAVLVALHGKTEDHTLLQCLRAADPDVRFLLGGFPDSARALAQWAADFDSSNYGQDPHDEADLTCTALARRQGQTELARAALIRILDDTGPRDEALLGSLVGEFSSLGDLGQAVRARRPHASLQDDASRSGAALADLASLQRRHGEVEAAWQSLQQAVAVLDGPPPPPPAAQPVLDLDLPKPPCQSVTWRGLGLGGGSPRSTSSSHRLLCRSVFPRWPRRHSGPGKPCSTVSLTPPRICAVPQRLRGRLQRPVEAETA
ncbi:hypothetical protein AB0O22_06005 [Streptomyces sp. NPDC091204]|uniref:hypothetical protein n=1 Tax=Streptomyces sp. NPDC091204 TaxID=3155299 RepID=UPI00341F7FA0